jgi:hypothetical protein
LNLEAVVSRLSFARVSMHTLAVYGPVCQFAIDALLLYGRLNPVQLVEQYINEKKRERREKLEKLEQAGKLTWSGQAAFHSVSFLVITIKNPTPYSGKVEFVPEVDEVSLKEEMDSAYRQLTATKHIVLVKTLEEEIFKNR